MAAQDRCPPKLPHLLCPEGPSAGPDLGDVPAGTEESRGLTAVTWPLLAVEVGARQSENRPPEAL